MGFFFFNKSFTFQNNQTQIHSTSVTFIVRYPKLLASPASWGWHCNWGSIFPTSHSGILGPPCTHSFLFTHCLTTAVLHDFLNLVSSMPWLMVMTLPSSMTSSRCSLTLWCYSYISCFEINWNLQKMESSLRGELCPQDTSYWPHAEQEVSLWWCWSFYQLKLPLLWLYINSRLTWNFLCQRSQCIIFRFHTQVPRKSKLDS